MLLKTTVPFDSLINFWRLTHLRNLHLRISSQPISESRDKFLKKIADSFPDLESLTIIRGGIGTATAGNTMIGEGIGALASLKNLRQLRLITGFVEGNVDQGVRQLADCVRLESLHLDAILNPWKKPYSVLSPIILGVHESIARSRHDRGGRRVGALVGRRLPSKYHHLFQRQRPRSDLETGRGQGGVETIERSRWTRD